MTTIIDRKPLLIVLTAPSGAGKTTLCNMVRSEYADNLAYSISCTTRMPRGEEEDGKHYFFLSDEEFDSRVTAGDFLEHAVVHGNKYGTLRSTVEDSLTGGKSVIMDIDVQGAERIRGFINKALPGDLLKDKFLDIFITPPSLDELEARLKGRGEDADDVITTRLVNAENEMQKMDDFKYVVINDDLDAACQKLKEILEKEWS